MLTEGNTLTGGLHGSHIPIPTTTRAIQHRPTPRGFDWGITRGPDPDAIARLAAQGRLTITPDTIDDRPVKVVRRVKGRRLEHGAPAANRAVIDEAALTAAYQAGAPIHELATQYGVAKSTISLRLQLLGVPKRRAGAGEPVPIERILELHAQGLTQTQIAQRVHLKASTISDRMRTAGVYVGRQTVGFDGEEAWRLAQLGVSTSAIAVLVGAANRKAVARYLKGRGHVFTTGGNDVRVDAGRIVQLHRDGMTRADIARTVGVSVATVRRHISRAAS